MTSQNVDESQAVEQRWPRVTMYSTSWCPDCRASKRYLIRNGIPFSEVDIDERPEAAELVRRLNRGMRRVPTIVIEDGPTLAEPSDSELGEALGVI